MKYPTIARYSLKNGRLVRDRNGDWCKHFDAEMYAICRATRTTNSAIEPLNKVFVKLAAENKALKADLEGHIAISAAECERSERLEAELAILKSGSTAA